MDRLIQSEPERLGRISWRLLVPPGADPHFQTRAIRIETVGQGSGHRWEQVVLAGAARGSRLLNLGNSGPLRHRDKFVVIHDAAVFRTPGNFGWRYRLAHRALSLALSRTGRIGTVSEFSRGELAAVLRLPEQRIVVVRNGCDHFAGRNTDPTALERLDVEPGRYFLFVGNRAPNKNLAVLLQAFARLNRPDARLVIAGSLDRSVFGGEGQAQGRNVVLAPDRSDAEIAALYANAAAHVFPSLYEGFGIPPLEAMASGCPVIASDIPVVREVCGEDASYFPPSDPDALAALLRHHWDVPQRNAAQQARAAARVARFTWESSARTLIDAVVS